MKRTFIVLIAVIVVGIGGYVGWQYLQASSDTKTTQNPNNQPTNDPSEGGKYLVIREWGVRLLLSENIKNAKYRYKDDRTIYLSTHKAEAIKGCEAGTTFSIQRAKKGEPIGPATVNELLQENPSILKQVDNDYYLFVAAPSNCASPQDQTGKLVLEEIRKEFSTASKSIERYSP